MDASEIIRRNKQKAVYINLLQQVNQQQGCVAANCSTTSECIFRFPTYETMENYYGGQQICDNCCPSGTTDSRLGRGVGFATNFTTTLDNFDNLYVVGGFTGEYIVFDINNNNPAPHVPEIRLTNSGQGVYLIKYNSVGIVQWATQINFTLTPANPFVISAPFVTTDGTDIYVNGRCGSLTDFFNATDGSTFRTPAAVAASINTVAEGLVNNLFVVRYSTAGVLVWVNQVTGAGSQFFPAGFTLGERGIKYSKQLLSPAPLLMGLNSFSSISFYNSWSAGLNTSPAIINYPGNVISGANNQQGFAAYMTSAGSISTILRFTSQSNSGTAYNSTTANVFIGDVECGSNGFNYIVGRAVDPLHASRPLYIEIDKQSFAGNVPTTLTSSYLSTVRTEFQNLLIQFNGTNFTLGRSAKTEARAFGETFVKVLANTDVVVGGTISSGSVALYNVAPTTSSPTIANISTGENFGSWYTYLYKYNQLGVGQWITQLGVVGEGIGNGLSFMTTDIADNIYLAGAFNASTIPYSWNVSGFPKTTGSPVSTNMPVIGWLGQPTSSINGFIAQYSTTGRFMNLAKSAGSSLTSSIFTLNVGTPATALQGGIAISSSTLVYSVGGFIASADFYRFSTVNIDTKFATLSTTNVISPYGVRYTF